MGLTRSFCGLQKAKANGTFGVLPAEVATYTVIKINAFVTVVFDPQGNCIPPPYSHWVDDCSSTIIRAHMPRTISASAIALFDVVGYLDPCVPDLLSQDKLNTTYSHQCNIPNGILQGLREWIILGTFLGFGCGEWAQYCSRAISSCPA